jgi:hypothetical protein
LLVQAHARFKYRKRTRTVVSALEEAYLREDVACGEKWPHGNMLAQAGRQAGREAGANQVLEALCTEKQ